MTEVMLKQGRTEEETGWERPRGLEKSSILCECPGDYMRLYKTIWDFMRLYLHIRVSWESDASIPAEKNECVRTEPVSLVSLVLSCLHINWRAKALISVWILLKDPPRKWQELDWTGCHVIGVVMPGSQEAPRTKMGVLEGQFQRVKRKVGLKKLPLKLNNNGGNEFVRRPRKDEVR